MGQVTAIGQIETHNSSMWFNQSGINSEVGWRAGIRLYIDAPFFGVQVEHFEQTLLAQQFHFVDYFVATVESSAWIAFGIFVGQAATKSLNIRINGPDSSVQ
jgi:hypothetical protein